MAAKIITLKKILPFVSYAILGTFAAGVVGTAYSSTLTIQGGAGGYTNLRVTSGSLPTGLSLSLSGNTITLSGTPTIDFTEQPVIAVDDALGATVTSSQTVPVGMTIRGLFLRYNFDEVTGTVANDLTGNGFNGTYSAVSGSIPTLGQTSILPSGKGKSALFGNLTNVNNVVFPNGFMPTLMKPPFTFLCFMKYVNNASLGHQLLSSGIANAGYNLYVSGNKLIAGVPGVSNNALDTRTLTPGTVYMVGFTVASNGDTYIYVNAVASAKFAGAFPSTNHGADPTWFGAYTGNSAVNHFNGNAQKMLLCNVDLSASEILAIYNAS